MIFFHKSKIDDVDYMGFVIHTNEKVFGLDVMVDIMSRVNVFDLGNIAVK